MSIKLSLSRLSGLGVIVFAMISGGCATPDAPDPRGKWRPVNRLADAPQAIPLQRAYIYQATPVDGTLRTMLSRWAADSRMTLSYLHPNDYTLYRPVANIRTADLVEAAAALSEAYAAQDVAVLVKQSQIVVSRIGDAGVDAAPVTGDAVTAAGE